MATFRARAGDQVIEDVKPLTLRPLLTSQAESPTVLLDGSDGRTARADRTEAGRWRIELVPEAGGRPLTATMPNGDAAFDALRSWAADDDWWLEAFTWRPEES